jgi:hypothetical protein
MDSNRDVGESFPVLVFSADELQAQGELLQQVVALVNSAYRDHNWLFPNQDRFDTDEQLITELDGEGRCAVILAPDPIATVSAKPCYAIHEKIPNEVNANICGFF